MPDTRDLIIVDWLFEELQCADRAEVVGCKQMTPF